MYINRIIKYFYWGLTILALICPVNIPFKNFLPGLFLMWLMYLIFQAGVKPPKIDLIQFDDNTMKDNKKNYLTPSIAVIYLIFYPLYTKFYTGINIFSSITNLFSGISNYYLYQNYFSEAELNQFSLNKLPFIIGHGVLRFMFIAIVFKTIIFKTRSSLIEKLSIAIMAVTIIVVGIARGTSFEFFELVLILFFAIISKGILSGQKHLMSKKLLIKGLIVSFIILSLFSYNINLRMGGSFSYFNDPDFDKGSILYLVSRPVALLVFSLYGYFLFGLYFNSIIINNLWFSSPIGFVSSLTPHGITLFNIDSGYRNFAGKIIDLGAKWNPDSSVLIESFGIILTFIIIYFLGRYSRKIYCEANKYVSVLILLFYIFYIMISLPMGNFITSSSANMISILIAIIFYRVKFLNRFLSF